MRTKRTTAYKCTECDTLWETQDEAQDCCPPEQIEAYKCGECEELYEDRDDAIDCCK